MHCTKAPSDEGAVSEADWGRDNVPRSNIFSPSVFAYSESTSLIRGRQGAPAPEQ